MAVTTGLFRRGDSSGSSLSTGAIVGLAVGIAVLFLLAISLFVVYWRRMSRHTAEDLWLQDPGHHDYQYPTGPSGEVEGPAYTMDHKSPPFGKSMHRPDVASPETAQSWSDSRGHGVALKHRACAMPTHPAYVPRAMVRHSISSRAVSSSAASHTSLTATPTFQPGAATGGERTRDLSLSSLILPAHASFKRPQRENSPTDIEVDHHHHDDQPPPSSQSPPPTHLANTATGNTMSSAANSAPLCDPLARAPGAGTATGLTVFRDQALTQQFPPRPASVVHSVSLGPPGPKSMRKNKRSDSRAKRRRHEEAQDRLFD